MDLEPPIGGVAALPTTVCLPLVNSRFGYVGSCARGHARGTTGAYLVDVDNGHTIAAALRRYCTGKDCAVVFVTDELEPFLSGCGDLPVCSGDADCPSLPPAAGN